MFTSLFIAILFVLLIIWARRTSKAFKDVDNLPGFWSLFAPLSPIGAMTPTMLLNPGIDWTWLWRSFAYERFSSDTLSTIPLVFGSPHIYTRSIHVARQVLGQPQYWKSPDSMRILLMWGDSVVTTNYDNYKRHRRIVAPGFTTKTYDLVWEQTMNTYLEMMDSEGWASQNSFSVPSLNPFVSKFALIIIARCGFGLPFPWKGLGDDQSLPHMSFDRALSIVSRNAIARRATSNWMYKLPIKALRESDEAYRVLSHYMNSFVLRKKDEIASETFIVDARNNDDLFTSLVRANGQDGKFGLSDEELIGNMFTFMLAGHETTAQTLSATLGLLALYPKEQDIVVEQIKHVLTDGRHPAIEDKQKLDKVLACFHEAARMFPAGFLFSRDTTETVVISLDHADGTHESITIPPGVRIVIDMIGINYNPRLFDEPEEFKPSRWYGKSDSDQTAFGFGPRACLGMKFALTEAVCFLTMLLKDWRVEPIFKAGETPEMWRSRVLQGSIRNGLAFGVRSVPLAFSRRTVVT